MEQNDIESVVVLSSVVVADLVVAAAAVVVVVVVTSIVVLPRPSGWPDRGGDCHDGSCHVW